MFAVVEISGKQYIAAPGDHLVVDRIDGEVGATVTLDRVLLKTDGKNAIVGTPFVNGAKVTAKIEKQGRGEKLNVRRFKSKVRYRKSIGFRAYETEISIVTVS